jgi:hypothetical protein
MTGPAEPLYAVKHVSRGVHMTENELVREWTMEEAATKGTSASVETVTPKVSRKAGKKVTASSGADHLPGIAPTTEDKNPGLPPDPPRTPAANTEVKP